VQNRRRIGGQMILLECDAQFESQANSVLDKLASLKDQGHTLHDGTKIQFGWSVLILRAENDCLRMCEPAFFGDALDDTSPTLDTTLSVLTAQVRILHAIREEGADVRFDQAVIFKRGVLELPEIFLKRDTTDVEGYSGWFIGDLNDIEGSGDEESLESLPIFELLKRRYAVLQVLALPPGYLVTMHEDRIVDILDSEEKSRWETLP
jgi:hypothetical protein